MDIVDILNHKIVINNKGIERQKMDAILDVDMIVIRMSMFKVGVIKKYLRTIFIIFQLLRTTITEVDKAIVGDKIMDRNKKRQLNKTFCI
jgi:hypothetical protein